MNKQQYILYKQASFNKVAMTEEEFNKALADYEKEQREKLGLVPDPSKKPEDLYNEAFNNARNDAAGKINQAVRDANAKADSAAKRWHFGTAIGAGAGYLTGSALGNAIFGDLGDQIDSDDPNVKRLLVGYQKKLDGSDDKDNPLYKYYIRRRKGNWGNRIGNIATRALLTAGGAYIGNLADRAKYTGDDAARGVASWFGNLFGGNRPKTK